MCNRAVHFGRTECGPVRNNNEDCWVADPRLGLYVVADGMGGARFGEVASRLVVERLPRLVAESLGGIEESEDAAVTLALERSLHAVNNAVLEHMRAEPERSGMGSTVVCALFRQGRVYLGHAGDSRAYRFGGRQLKRLTRDHTLAQILVDNDLLTEEEATVDERSHQLTQFIGMEPEQFGPVCQSFALVAGETFLLCSDGLTGMLSDTQIAEHMAAGSDVASSGNTLVEAALAAGGKDNVTVLLVMPEPRPTDNEQQEERQKHHASP